MPGPIIQNTTNPVMDWANDQSVMDPLYETLIKKAISTGGDLMGANDPETSVTSLMNPMTTPAVTIARIPFHKVAESNQYLKHMAQVMGLDEATRDAIDYASQKYPRVLAHVAAVTKREPKNMLEKLGGLAGAQSPMGMEGFSHIGIKQGMKPKDTFNTFGHELTHAAQQIWHGNKLEDLYDQAGRGMNYYNSVYEQGARKAGDNFQKKAFQHYGIEEDPGVIQRLMNFFSGE